jgi:hypothetical protein
MRNGACKFNLPCHKLATSYLWQGKLVYISYLCNHREWPISPTNNTSTGEYLQQHEYRRMLIKVFMWPEEVIKTLSALQCPHPLSHMPAPRLKATSEPQVLQLADGAKFSTQYLQWHKEDPWCQLWWYMDTHEELRADERACAATVTLSVGSMGVINTNILQGVHLWCRLTAGPSLSPIFTFPHHRHARSRHSSGPAGTIPQPIIKTPRVLRLWPCKIPLQDPNRRAKLVCQVCSPCLISPSWARASCVMPLCFVFLPQAPQARWLYISEMRLGMRIQVRTSVILLYKIMWSSRLSAAFFLRL